MTDAPTAPDPTVVDLRAPAAGTACCPGYPAPYDELVASFPGADVYPSDSFRTEWGPIFHRGRLDGSARVLVLGQDPATHEAITRRILVGEAGQRTQGFLYKAGIDRSYVMVNTFLYSVYGQGGGTRHRKDPAIIEHRHRWLDALVANEALTAVVTLGTLAAEAYAQWIATPTGAAAGLHHAAIIHPTFPESSSASGTTTKAAAMARMLADWNEALPGLRAAVEPDTARPLQPYGTALTDADLAPIPAGDLPPGLPPWMRDLKAWARRTGDDAATKRATITVTVPRGSRPPS